MRTGLSDKCLYDTDLILSLQNVYPVIHEMFLNQRDLFENSNVLDAVHDTLLYLYKLELLNLEADETSIAVAAVFCKIVNSYRDDTRLLLELHQLMVFISSHEQLSFSSLVHIQNIASSPNCYFICAIFKRFSLAGVITSDNVELMLHRFATCRVILTLIHTIVTFLDNESETLKKADWETLFKLADYAESSIIIFESIIRELQRLNELTMHRLNAFFIVLGAMIRLGNTPAQILNFLIKQSDAISTFEYFDIDETVRKLFIENKKKLEVPLSYGMSLTRVATHFSPVAEEACIVTLDKINDITTQLFMQGLVVRGLMPINVISFCLEEDTLFELSEIYDHFLRLPFWDKSILFRILYEYIIPIINGSDLSDRDDAYTSVQGFIPYLARFDFLKNVPKETRQLFEEHKETVYAIWNTGMPPAELATLGPFTKKIIHQISPGNHLLLVCLSGIHQRLSRIHYLMILLNALPQLTKLIEYIQHTFTEKDDQAFVFDRFQQFFAAQLPQIEFPTPEDVCVYIETFLHDLILFKFDIFYFPESVIIQLCNNPKDLDKLQEVNLTLEMFCHLEPTVQQEVLNLELTSDYILILKALLIRYSTTSPKTDASESDDSESDDSEPDSFIYDLHVSLLNQRVVDEIQSLVEKLAPIYPETFVEVAVKKILIAFHMCFKPGEMTTETILFAINHCVVNTTFESEREMHQCIAALFSPVRRHSEHSTRADQSKYRAIM